MNSKKKIAVFFTVIVLFGNFGTHLLFGAKDPWKEKGLYTGKIIIGIAPWPGYLPLIVASDKGYFKEAGLDVEIKSYPGLSELSKDSVAGTMQGRANLTLDAIKEYLGGFDHHSEVCDGLDNASSCLSITRKSGNPLL